MRIITGIARGAKLKTLSGEETRPTSEMTKEAMFSAIQFELHDRSVLDLFGGSGQLALEALSRGAERAVIIDASRAACEIIKENAMKTGLMKQCRVVSSDWKDYIRGASGKDRFGLVFLDPPYTDGLLDTVLKRLFEADILEKNAIIVAESAAGGVPEPIEGCEMKLYRHGKTFVSILRLSQEEEK